MMGPERDRAQGQKPEGPGQANPLVIQGTRSKNSSLKAFKRPFLGVKTRIAIDATTLNFRYPRPNLTDPRLRAAPSVFRQTGGNLAASIQLPWPA